MFLVNLLLVKNISVELMLNLTASNPIPFTQALVFISFLFCHCEPACRPRRINEFPTGIILKKLTCSQIKEVVTLEFYVLLVINNIKILRKFTTIRELYFSLKKN